MSDFSSELGKLFPTYRGVQLEVVAGGWKVFGYLCHNKRAVNRAIKDARESLSTSINRIR